MQEIDIRLGGFGIGDNKVDGINTTEDDHWDVSTDRDTEVEIPFRLVEYVDDGVKKLLPKGIESLGIRPHGTSHWSRTAEVHGTIKGDPVSFFLKVTRNRFGMMMVRGAYEGSKAIYSSCPDLCPPPIGWGLYESDTRTYFMLSEFVDMVDDLPDMHAFTRRLAEMHTMAIAPDGKYGFHVQVMCALLPIFVGKSESWEQFYTKYMKHLFAAETRAQGKPTEEMERLIKSLFDRIIPRLVRPLETGGRNIKPSLVHSDLWDGNAGMHSETDEPLIFDPSCFYGHNEFDLGPWRCPRHKTGRPYIEAYHRSLAKSAPEEDHEGRMILYFLSFDTRASACWVGRGDFRES